MEVAHTNTPFPVRRKLLFLFLQNFHYRFLDNDEMREKRKQRDASPSPNNHKLYSPFKSESKISRTGGFRSKYTNVFFGPTSNKEQILFNDLRQGLVKGASGSYGKKNFYSKLALQKVGALHFEIAVPKRSLVSTTFVPTTFFAL